MVEVQGNSVRLYMEGLMFFALDQENNRLEAGILNVDDGHNLKIRTFSRKEPKNGAYIDEVWEVGGHESIPDADLRLYDQGEITILCPGGESKNICSPMVPRNQEMWMPFNLIPEFEDIVGSTVKLDRTKVKPVLNITGGNFFSVLKPDHVEDAKPFEKRAGTRGFFQTYRFDKDLVVSGKIRAKTRSPNLQSVDDLVACGIVAEDLAIRTYTAATMITLNKGEELVCVLKREGGESRELFRVKYASDCEAKVVLENAVTQHDGHSHVHSHNGAEKSDPINYFHFLHFYDAIKECNEKKQFFLASEDRIMEYMKDDTVTLMNGDAMTLSTTGGDHPTCPAIRVPSGSLTD